MSRFLLRVVLSTGICLWQLGGTRAAEPDTSARPLPSAGQSKILRALDQRTSCEFRERPFSEVVDHFKQQHEIEILLDSDALVEAGIDSHTPITQALANVSLRSALRLLFMRLELTYVVGDGYLLITSKTEAENKLNRKIYPVHDLVTLDSEFRPGPPKRDKEEDSPVSSEVFNAGGLGGGGLGLGGVSGHVDEAGDFQNLIDTITSSVAPTMWDEVGGPGTITANPNMQAIAVLQTEEVHEEIAVLLAALRRVRDEQFAAAKAHQPASPPAPAKDERLKLRGYRLMRGTMNKSGWRPPVQVAGDVRSSGRTQAVDGKQEAAQPSAANPRDEKLEAWAEKIAKLVPEMIEPQSWQPLGRGTIRAVGEAVVVEHTEEMQRRVARLMAELVPDCVPLGMTGPWGPWRVALQVDHPDVRLRLSPTAKWPQQAEPSPCGAEARLQEALDEKCDLDFQQVPLGEALSRLAEQRHVQLYIDHKALAEAGFDIGTDPPVTHSVKGLSYRAALALLLDDLHLSYSIRHEVLLITTETAAENLPTTRVYPVFDLVVRPPDAPASRPGLDFESLTPNIVASIAPTSWDEVGGPGSIKHFTNSGALVISQTTLLHDEIAEYLRAMREVGAAQRAELADD